MTRSGTGDLTVAELTFLIINFLVLHTCWLANAFGASYGVEYLGPMFVLPSLMLHFGLVENRPKELSMVLLVAGLGYASDFIQMSYGVMRFHPNQLLGRFPPLWILSQWMIYATAFRFSLKWLQGHLWLAACLGAVGGPAVYWGGAQLDALMIHPNYLFSLGSLALFWGGLTPLFVWFAHRGHERQLAIHESATPGTI